MLACFLVDLCEGDCDKDTDCAGALVCVRRSGAEMVGGCGLPGPDTGGRDVCAPANANANAGSSEAKKCLELYAVGLRNPFRLSMNPNVENTEFMVSTIVLTFPASRKFLIWASLIALSYCAFSIKLAGQ